MVVLMTAACIVQPVRVQGIAMEPALRDGDRIFIERNPEKLDRGDIIIFYYPADQTKSFIKRIVGLPNETVEVREGKVMINGRIIEEPYIDAKFNKSWRNTAEIKLGEDSYYVLGDNRDNSSDSRIWGPVQRKLVYGKYTMKYF